MTDKVQKIREEVVRLVNNHDSALDYEAALEDVLNIIDSMQEEPKFKIGDRVKIEGRTAKGDVIRNIYQAEDGNTYFEFENSDDAPADCDWELVEEPKKCMYTKDDFTDEDRRVLCDGCEEDCVYNKEEKPSKKNFRERYKRIAQSDAFKKAHEGMSVGEVIPVEESSIPKIVDEHFWEMLGKEPVSEELKDYADKYAAETCHLMVVAGEYDDNSIEEYLMQACIDSANWQKQQMMAKAVDVAAHIDAGGYPYIPQMELYDYDKDAPLAKEGDKYKMILIKE